MKWHIHIQGQVHNLRIGQVDIGRFDAHGTRGAAPPRRPRGVADANHIQAHELTSQQCPIARRREGIHVDISTNPTTRGSNRPDDAREPQRSRLNTRGQKHDRLCRTLLKRFVLGWLPGSRRVDSKGCSVAEAGERAKVHLALDRFAAPATGGAIVGRKPDEWAGTGAGILGSARGGRTNYTLGP